MNTVYWITGLSGSGKTTLGRALLKKLEFSGKKTIFLDGDEMRPLICNDLGYSEENRRSCALRYGGLCKLLSDQGFTVICCTISMFHQVQDWNRENILNYKEVLVQVSEETLLARNQKNLYLSNTADMMGRDIQAEFPKKPDIIIFNDEGDIDEKTNKILNLNGEEL